MAVMDCLLRHQREGQVKGNLIEFGVYKGRSAAILAHHCETGERLILVDVAEYIERAAIARICPAYEFVLSSSENFKSVFPGYRSLKRASRVLHVDSSHFFNTTIRELEMSEELIADKGIVILDDFTNLDYSQILAATYKYLYTRRTQLAVFLVTLEKAYLCRKADFEFYGNFVLHNLVDAMAEHGQHNTCISRTDINVDYRSFCLRALIGAEQGKRYGAELYKQYYLKP